MCHVPTVLGRFGVPYISPEYVKHCIFSTALADALGITLLVVFDVLFKPLRFSVCHARLKTYYNHYATSTSGSALDVVVPFFFF